MTKQHINAGLAETVKRLPVNVGETVMVNPENVNIITAGSFVPIGGTSWVSGTLNEYTSNTAGRMIYTGRFRRSIQVIATATVEKVGGGADLSQLAIAINNIERTKTVSGTKNKDPTALTSVGVFQLTEGESIQVFVANMDTTANVLVSTANLSVTIGSII